jgi:hypothetical protein
MAGMVRCSWSQRPRSRRKSRKVNKVLGNIGKGERGCNIVDNRIYTSNDVGSQAATTVGV